MKKLMILAILAFGPAAAADELQLKDGKKVEWAALRDQGDTYEVETPQGNKVTVKKSDVEKFVPTTPGTALTGASFSFDAKKKLTTVDLLARVDPKKDGLSGQWSVKGGAVVGVSPSHLLPMGADHGKLQISYTPPEEYDLTCTFERKDGSEDLGFGLIGGGKQVVFALDAWASWSGLFDVDGKGCDKSGLGVQGKAIENNKPRTIVFMVRKDALVVRLDGKDHWVWKAEWDKCSVNPYHSIVAKNFLWLTTYKSTYAISALKVSFLKAAP